MNSKQAEVVSFGTGVEGYLELDQEAAEKLLDHLASESNVQASLHLAASIKFGRRSKILSHVSMAIMLAAVFIKDIIGGTSSLNWILNSSPWLTAMAGMMLHFFTESMEYPKRAERHDQAHREFSGIYLDIHCLKSRKSIHNRDIEQIKHDYKRIVQLAQSANPGRKHSAK